MFNDHHLLLEPENYAKKGEAWVLLGGMSELLNVMSINTNAPQTDSLIGLLGKATFSQCKELDIVTTRQVNYYGW